MYFSNIFAAIYIVLFFVMLSSTPTKNHAIYQNSDTRYISDFFNFSLTEMLVQKRS